MLLNRKCEILGNIVLMKYEPGKLYYLFYVYTCFRSHIKHFLMASFVQRAYIDGKGIILYRILRKNNLEETMSMAYVEIRMYKASIVYMKFL